MVERVATEKATVFPHKPAVGIKGCAQRLAQSLADGRSNIFKTTSTGCTTNKKTRYSHANSYFTSREAYGDFWQLVEATKISSFQLSYHHRRKKKLLVVYKKLYSIAIAIILVFHTNIADTV
jgi:hypothetical protein